MLQRFESRVSNDNRQGTQVIFKFTCYSCCCPYVDTGVARSFSEKPELHFLDDQIAGLPYRVSINRLYRL